MIIKVTTGRDCNGVLRCYKIERSDGSIWYAPLDPANTVVAPAVVLPATTLFRFSDAAKE